MIAAAAIILMRTSGLNVVNLGVSSVTVALLATRKIPAPLIVLLACFAGFMV